MFHIHFALRVGGGQRWFAVAELCRIIAHFAAAQAAEGSQDAFETNVEQLGLLEGGVAFGVLVAPVAAPCLVVQRSSFVQEFAPVTSWR